MIPEDQDGQDMLFEECMSAMTNCDEKMRLDILKLLVPYFESLVR